jgi:hypothetical protein
MTKKVYKSEVARKMAEHKPPKPQPRPSKKFRGRDRHGGGKGQSGRPNR